MNETGYPGRLITLEGTEGGGKSSALSVLAGFLRDQGKRVLVTREPGGTQFGEKLRTLLLDRDSGALAPETELLLMFAARAEHFHKVIEPALQGGDWVLSDRFTDASYAYQGGGRGLAEERIQVLENWLLGAFRPDLVMVLDVPVEVGLGRVTRRGDKDRFEQEERAFFERARAVYLRRAQREPARIKVIDATASAAEVSQELIRVVRGLLL